MSSEPLPPLPESIKRVLDLMRTDPGSYHTEELLCALLTEVRRMVEAGMDTHVACLHGDLTNPSWTPPATQTEYARQELQLAFDRLEARILSECERRYAAKPSDAEMDDLLERIEDRLRRWPQPNEPEVEPPKMTLDDVPPNPIAAFEFGWNLHRHRAARGVR